MAEDTGRQRDFVLAPNEFLFVQDRTKGGLQVQVGPTTGTLQAGSEPVTYDAKNDRFVQANNVQQAIQHFPSAAEGSYVVLENPATEEKRIHPDQANVNNFTTRLDMGRKINVPGPQTFALWPGQVATVVPGHQLRTNQYLVALVYNDEAAQTNWKSAVMKPAEAPASIPPAGTAGEGTQPSAQPAPAVAQPAVAAKAVEPPKLTMGQLIIIRGTDVSFYIPPTGLEVVTDDAGEYVREAVTLERLEYCILLSEDGNKRYVRGPAVVFPEPTETFITALDSKNRKFKAIELNPDMGLYIKVTADYEEDGTQHTAGDELFVTGKEQRLYFPRAEHALIKYGDREIQYGVAIPEGEARYVLNKETGSVDLVKGPRIFLPDPRTQVIVRRVLSDSEVSLLYPGNLQASQYNASLREIAGAKGAGSAPLADGDVRGLLGRATPRGSRQSVPEYAAEAFFAGDSLNRGTSHTPPRTITLDTKYEGAVAVNVWKGYAVLVLNKAGNQRVEVGPKTVLLAYDETLQVLELSKGKPKTNDRREKTVYLRVHYNQVSDYVDVVTKDMVNVQVRLAYRVNFVGEPERWFGVEDYVKFLTDDGRSRLRSAAKRFTIEEFNQDYIDIVRDTILGAKPESGGRAGKSFEENGLQVYDVELNGITIGDGEISGLLTDQQHQAVTAALMLASREQLLKDTERLEAINRDVAAQKFETEGHARGLTIETLKGRQIVAAEELKVQAADNAAKDAAHTANLARIRAADEQQLNKLSQEQKLRLEVLDAEVKAVVDKTKAIGPDLIAALSAFSEKDSAIRLAQSLSPLALLGGTSVSEVIGNILGGTSIGETAKAALKTVIAPAPPNGPDRGGAEAQRASR